MAWVVNLKLSESVAVQEHWRLACKRAAVVNDRKKHLQLTGAHEYFPYLNPIFFNRKPD